MRLADEAARLGRGRVVGIKSGLFSRALIDHLHDEGAFGENDRWGRNRDHGRLRELFDARHFDDEDEREAEAIIRRCVYPWLRGFWQRTRTEASHYATLQDHVSSTNMSTNTSTVTEVVSCLP